MLNSIKTDWRSISVASVKIGQLLFHVVNRGLLIETEEGKQYRFDPEQSRSLINFLSQNQQEFGASAKATEPTPRSNEMPD